jgi:hypothetical protein
MDTPSLTSIITTSISTLGFPIVLIGYLPLRFEKKIEMLNQTIREMTEIDLFILVQKEKKGGQESLNQIIVMFHPLIVIGSQRANPNERCDVQQDLTEKVIRAVRLTVFKKVAPFPPLDMII